MLIRPGIQVYGADGHRSGLGHRYDAAILPLLAGNLPQLEMSQKRLQILGRTLGHTPSLGVFCWLEVIDFDPFFGFLFLVLHVCYLTQGLPAYPEFAGRSSQKRNSFKKTAAIDFNRRTIWIVDAHRGNGRR